MATGALFRYMQMVQRLVHDTKQSLLDPADLIFYINDARREVAMRSQCIRVLPMISGSIVRATITAGGTGYTNPTVVISAPDFPSGALPFPNGDQATGTATQVGGVIDNVFINYGGAGYFEPTITITDPTGKGAIIAAVMSPMNLLQQGQEVYNFSDVDLSPFPGVGAIYTIRSVSILYTNYRYSLPVYSFSVYQAKCRQYSGGSYQYVPVFASQFGQGAGGSLYLYPPPSQTYQLELDCSCLPQDLVTNDSEEAIPQPWDDAVAYWAARTAYLELQNHNLARSMESMFDQRMTRFGAYKDKGRAVNPYGRP